MNIFNLFKKKKDPHSIRHELVEFTYNAVTTELGVRVEDAVCLMSTIVAEKCIDLAEDYDLYDHDYTPGERILSNQINEILIGDHSTNDWNEIPAESVFGTLFNNLKRLIALDKFPEPTSIFESFVKGIGAEVEWGNIPYTVPEEHFPSLLPLRIGFESREAVDKILNQAKLDKQQRLQILVNALSDVLSQTKEAIDPAISLRLAFELLNGMSKTAPMTVKHFKDATKE